MIRHPKYTKGNLYLSGGMQMKKDLGASWRKTCSKHLKDLGYLPLDICELDRAYANAHLELFYAYDDKFSTTEQLQFKSNIRKHFVRTDLKLVDADSDAIVVLWDKSAALGGGTHNEISHAYEHDIPIFLVTKMEIVKIPGWIISQTTKIFNSFEELYEYLEKLPDGILRKDMYGNRGTENMYLCSLCGDTFKKDKHHFVSKVSPLYCKCCVDVVEKTYEGLVDRYQFFVEYLDEQAIADKVADKLKETAKE